MRFGEYETTRLLGKGGMSEVYEAYHVRVGSRHALKLYTYPKDSEDVRQRFETEGRLLARLDYPRIVKVTDFGTDTVTGRPYFVMTLITNAEDKCVNLADIPPEELDEEKVGMWYDDIREALAYIHGKGIIHRDLKLQNVLIAPDGHAVLTDFGISRVFAPPGKKLAVANPVDTIVRMQEGHSAVMGSLGYMAPELEMGLAATPASDLYALGVLTYKLLTGTWCDARTNLAETLDSFDPVWQRIIPKLLHSHPEAREALGYVQEKERDRAAQEIATEDLHILKKERRRFRRFVALGILAVAGICVILGAWRQGALNTRLSIIERQLALPTFEDVFAIPETSAEKPTEEMPSQAQFTSALIDAHILTQGIFADVHEGICDKAKLKMTLGRMMRTARTSPQTLFQDLPATYHPSGENKALAILLEDAARRIR